LSFEGVGELRRKVAGSKEGEAGRTALATAVAGLLLTVALSAAAPGEELARRLGLGPALAANLEVSECRRSFRGLPVRLLQGRYDAAGECYAWAGVFRDGRLLSEVRPSPIRAGKGPWGLLLPVKQPSPEVFLLLERGAGGDRVHALCADGTVAALPGREAVISPDGSLLATFTPARTGPLALFDIASRRVIFSNETAEPGIFGWYAMSGALVGSVVVPSARGFDESPRFYYLADPAHGQFRLVDEPLPDSKKRKRLEPVPFSAPRPCRCGP
jgi:hypothetical protein